MDLLNKEDENLQTCMSTMFSNIRGHGPYWQAVKLDLKAHTAVFGPPTWFVTLNPDFQHWKDLFKAYSDIYKTTINENNIKEYVAKDPVIYSRHFHRRLTHLINDIIYAKEKPIGNVIHHFIRIEYQHRG